MLQVITIPARQDNYIWLIIKGQHAVVVDPGDAKPVLERLQMLELTLDAILLTHHHHDHIDGVPQLLAQYPDAVCYGPCVKHPLLDSQIPLNDGQTLSLPQMKISFEIMALPGHTREHIAYFGHGALFCGDVLFAGGCGRLLDGTPEQMYDSLQRIKLLPPETLIYPAHEYTQSNLTFCQRVEPNNQLLAERIRVVSKLRHQNVPTLPTHLVDELTTNVFLRTHIPAVQQWAELNAQCKCENEIQVFAMLREKKNNL
jgi:hydroxyacylglutathione hydrolase